MNKKILIVEDDIGMQEELKDFVNAKEKRKESNMPVIILTSRASELDEALSISYGVDDFITKPYNPTILLLRIKKVFKRLNQVKDKIKYCDLIVYQSKGILVRNKKTIELIKNKMIILLYLLTNQNRIVSHDELMSELWNNDNTLTVNISRLRSKLASFGYSEAIKTRKGQGYILL